MQEKIEQIFSEIATFINSGKGLKEEDAAIVVSGNEGACMISVITTDGKQKDIGSYAKFLHGPKQVKKEAAKLLGRVIKEMAAADGMDPSGAEAEISLDLQTERINCSINYPHMAS